jgi:hypothetical protein
MESEFTGPQVLPAIGVATQVGQFLTPDGVEHGMLLELFHGEDDGQSIVFAVSVPGVAVLKNAISQYESNLREVLAGRQDAVVLQAEGE